MFKAPGGWEAESLCPLSHLVVSYPGPDFHSVLWLARGSPGGGGGGGGGHFLDWQAPCPGV